MSLKKHINSPLFNNEKGLSSLALLFCLMLFSLGVLLINSAYEQNKRIHIRKKTLLCLKEKEVTRQKYLKIMASFNKSIHAAFLARAIPPIAPYARMIHQSTMRLQQFYFVSHMKNLWAFQFCNSLQGLFYFKKIPHKTRAKLVLLRRLDGTAPLKSKKWKEFVWSKDFTLVFQSELQLNNRFAISAEIKRKELSKEALLRWKDSYGVLLSSVSL